MKLIKLDYDENIKVKNQTEEIDFDFVTNKSTHISHQQKNSKGYN